MDRGSWSPSATRPSYAWSLKNGGWVQSVGGRGGAGHSGPAHLHNFIKPKKLNQAPRHLGGSSQQIICDKNATF